MAICKGCGRAFGSATEQERMNQQIRQYQKITEKTRRVNAELQAEVERLKQPWSQLTKTMQITNDKLLAENKRLQEALEYAHCQLLNINTARKASNKFVVNLELIEQALKGE